MLQIFTLLGLLYSQSALHIFTTSAFTSLSSIKQKSTSFTQFFNKNSKQHKKHKKTIITMKESHNSQHQFQSNEITYCRKSLLSWYNLVKRDLPWRQSENKTPYAIWVSEIMSQQTRIETVIPYWTRWMSRYPTIQALSEASLDDINFMWAGLGSLIIVIAMLCSGCV